MVLYHQISFAIYQLSFAITAVALCVAGCVAWRYAQGQRLAWFHKGGWRISRPRRNWRNATGRLGR